MKSKNQPKKIMNIYSNKNHDTLSQKPFSSEAQQSYIIYIPIDIGITSVEHPILPHFCLIHDSSSKKMSILSNLVPPLGMPQSEATCLMVLPMESLHRIHPTQKKHGRYPPKCPSIGETPKNLMIFLPKSQQEFV